MSIPYWAEQPERKDPEDYLERFNDFDNSTFESGDVDVDGYDDSDGFYLARIEPRLDARAKR